MADIKKELNDIKNAVYGKEVRGSIHDGIKKINDEVENATDLSESAKHQVENIQQQVNQLVVEGDSSVEAAQARVSSDGTTYGTLKQRLDTEYGELSSQLAQIEHVKDLKVVNPSMSQTDIQEVISGGGTIQFTEGVYNITLNGLVGFQVPSNTTILLDSKAVIQLAPNDQQRYYIFDLSNVENVTIRGGQIVGDRENHKGTGGEWGHGIRISGAKNVVIDNVHVSKCWGDGIAIGASGQEPNLNHSENVNVTNCVLDHNRRLGIAVTALKGGRITGNKILNTIGTLPEAGIDLEPDRHRIVENLSIRDNRIIENNKEGILISIRQNLIGDAFIRNIVIDGNTIDNNGDYGIRAGAECTPLFINNNVLTRNRGGVTLSSNHNKITNNLMKDNRGFGINLYQARENLIKGNTIDSNGSIGVSFQDGSDFNQFTANRVLNNNRNGVNVNSSSDNVFTENVFENNGVENAEDNMYAGLNFVSSSRRNFVANNKFIGGSHQEYGLRVGDGTSTSNVATNNDVRRGGTVSEIITQGATIQVGGGNFRLSGYSTEVDIG